MLLAGFPINSVINSLRCRFSIQWSIFELVQQASELLINVPSVTDVNNLYDEFLINNIIYDTKSTDFQCLKTNQSERVYQQPYLNQLEDRQKRTIRRFLFYLGDEFLLSQLPNSHFYFRINSINFHPVKHLSSEIRSPFHRDIEEISSANLTGAINSINK